MRFGFSQSQQRLLPVSEISILAILLLSSKKRKNMSKASPALRMSSFILQRDGEKRRGSYWGFCGGFNI